MCRRLGINDFQFIKVPKFGWFAYNQNRSHIVHLFQLFSDAEVLKLFRRFTTEDIVYQDFTMLYSEASEAKLYRDYTQMRLWASVFKDACAEAVSGHLSYTGNSVKLHKFLKDNGMSALTKTPIGLLTPKVMTKYKNIKWEETDKYKLVVPTYCTPMHACSYELFNVKELSLKRPLFTNGEKGWYGTVDGMICSDFQEMALFGGCTWDKKLDLWTQRPVDLSPDLGARDRLKIWAGAINTQFAESPLRGIVAQGLQDEVKLHCRELTAKQIKHAEQELGVHLFDHWVGLQEREIQIGDLKFTEQSDKYFVHRRGRTGVAEMTNFTVTIDKLVKSNHQFFRQGTINYQGTSTPFIFDEMIFGSYRALEKGIRAFFVNHGLGIPIILNSHRKYLMDIVDRFNQHAPVETSC